MHKKTKIDPLRAIAWFHAVREASGRSAAQLKAESFFTDPDAPATEVDEEWPWHLYESGEQLPKAATVALVEERWSGTAAVFETGPDGYPWWSFLEERPARRRWQDRLDGWLYGQSGPIKAKPEDVARLAAMRSRPLHAKLDEAWWKLVPREAALAVDWLDYASGKQPNVVARPMRDYLAQKDWLERKAKKRAEGSPHPPSLTADEEALLATMRKAAEDVVDDVGVAGVLALWRLAEEAGEGRNEARYLARGVLPWVAPLLAAWGIGERYAALLDAAIIYPDPAIDLIRDEDRRNRD